MLTFPLSKTKAFVYEQTIPYKDFNGSRNHNFLNETVRSFPETKESSASLTAQRIRNPVNMNCTPCITSREEITRILWNKKVHYDIHKCPQFVPVLSKTDNYGDRKPVAGGPLEI